MARKTRVKEVESARLVGDNTRVLPGMGRGSAVFLMSTVTPVGINPIQVGRDVRVALRGAVIANSGVNEETFSWDLVPNKEPFAGFGADEVGWYAILKSFAARLHNIDPIYEVFVAQPRHSQATLDEPLETTVKLVREEIIDLLTR